MRTSYYGKFVVWVALAVMGACAHAQSYPSRPIRLLTGTPGSSTDLVARLVGKEMTTTMGQPIVVENRGGGGPVIGPVIKTTPPDGYSVFFFGSTLWISPLTDEDIHYDPIRDFAPITLGVTSPSILVVNQSLGVNSVKELIALAKEKPGALNYGSTGSGSVSYLGMELLKSMTGTNFVRINYKGAEQAASDLVSGNVQVMFVTTTGASGLVKAGKVKTLAVSSEHPSSLAPGLPSVADAGGLPGFEASSVLGFVAPAKTPPSVITRLNRELVHALFLPASKEKFLNVGVEPVGNSPQEFEAYIQADLNRFGKALKEAGASTN